MQNPDIQLLDYLITKKMTDRNPMANLVAAIHFPGHLSEQLYDLPLPILTIKAECNSKVRVLFCLTRLALYHESF
jgi:hypothetical protein